MLESRTRRWVRTLTDRRGIPLDNGDGMATPVLFSFSAEKESRITCKSSSKVKVGVRCFVVVILPTQDVRVTQPAIPPRYRSTGMQKKPGLSHLPRSLLNSLDKVHAGCSLDNAAHFTWLQGERCILKFLLHLPFTKQTEVTSLSSTATI